MIRKCHNHTTQTNTRHNKDEPDNNHKTPGIQNKAKQSALHRNNQVSMIRKYHRDAPQTNPPYHEDLLF